MPDQPAPPPPDADGDYPSPAYAWYVVGVLTLIYVFSFIDRQILSLLVGPLKRDLQITDTQMSLLMGFSFAVFYTFFGMPIGWLADVMSRRGIIAGGLGLWSAMTAGCGTAKKFGAFLGWRMGVGVGEAALSPAAYSLITDYFPPRRLGTAIGAYSMGIYIGSGLAMIVGGTVVQWASKSDALLHLPIVGDTRPWQAVFFIVGLPGLALVPILATIKEPKRRGMGGKGGSSFGEVARYIGANGRAFLLHNLGFAFCAFAAYGSSQWIPELFVRLHHWTKGEIGMRYGLVVTIFGTAGVLAGGRVADWLTQKGYKDAKVRVGLLAPICWLPSGILFPLMPNGWLALVVMIPAVFMTSVPFGVAPAAIQEMTPPSMRGQASALYLFVINLIGLGLGPTAVALVTDRVFKNPEKLHLSLLLVTTVAYAAAIILLTLALKPFARTVEALKGRPAGQR